MSDDITHSSGPRGRIERLANQERAVPRMLDQLPVIPPRDLDHEVAPHVPPPAKTGGELLADQAIAVLDQTVEAALTQIRPLRERCDAAEQVILKAGVDGRENIRAQFHLIEATMKMAQQLDKQLAEAMKPLAALTNGK